ncbi:MAG: hypothetical protein RMJ44_12495, partial [Cytophagales bacterium]|nr:hypothetical protein [Cytophagales bacterium]
MDMKNNVEIVTFPRPFGVEIEYISEKFFSRERYDAHKRRKIIYKRDGSLQCGDGFPVEVAIPFSYSTKRLHEWWSSQKNVVNTVNETCGLHVHICMCNPRQAPSQRVKNIAARVWQQYFLLQEEINLIVHHSRVDN